MNLITLHIECNYFSPDVEFCGYTVPHPSENKMHFRIQANPKIKALDVLKRGLEDIEKVCDHTLETFEREMEEFMQQQ